MDTLEELRDWVQALNAARRTLLCPPGLESRVKDCVDAKGLGGVIAVQVTPHLPPGVVMMCDHSALEDGVRQAASRLG